MLNAARPGMRLHAQYLASEVFAGTKSRNVVLSLNLGWFSQISEPGAELAALFPESRWPEAMTMPLHEANLSADRALLYRSIWRSDAVALWSRLQREQTQQARISNWVAKGVNGWAEELVPTAAPRELLARFQRRATTRIKEGVRRATRLAAERRLSAVFGGIPPDHPRLRMLRAILHRLRDSGARVLVYVAPINVDHLRDVGVYDEGGIGDTSAVLREVVESSGGDFLDLHDLLPDRCFADEGDHLALDAKPAPSILIASRLSGWVLQERGERPGRRPKRTARLRRPRDTNGQ